MHYLGAGRSAKCGHVFRTHFNLSGKQGRSDSVNKCKVRTL